MCMERTIKTLKKAMRREKIHVGTVDAYLCDKGFSMCGTGVSRLIYETPDANGYICVIFDYELGIPIVNDVYSMSRGV